MKDKIECGSLTEVRSEIDRIDKMVIELLGERYQYVKEAVRFKTNAVEVKSENRYLEVLKARREWALEVGLDANIIEKIYSDLINYFISEEMDS